MKMFLSKRLCFVILFLLTNYQIHPQEKDLSVQSFIQILNDKNLSDEEREKAVEHLESIKATDEETIAALINCLSDKNPFLVGGAVKALTKIGKPAIEFLIPALQDKDENKKYGAAIVLSKLGKEASPALPYLIEALKDENENVRYCSAIALANLETDAVHAIKNLTGLLFDNDEDVRWAAYFALNKIEKRALHYQVDLSTKISAVDSLTPLLMKELIVPGASVSIISDYKIISTKQFGLANVNEKIPVTSESIFEACSMTKPMFAYVALKLVDDGKLELDKPLFNYLEEKFICENNYDKLITARMILSHTSGLPNWRKGEEEREGPIPIYFKPGTHFSYSGEGMYYLQRAIEKITGESLNALSKRILFVPLGLTHTSFVWMTEIDSFISAGHDTAGNYLTRSKYAHANSAYTLYTTPEEYAKFLIEIMKPDRNGNSFLSDKMKEEMITPQIGVYIREPIDRPGNTLGLSVSWGLGWAIDSTASGKIVYHSGANRTGFRCYSQFNPAKGSGIVIMTNGLNGSDLWRRIISNMGDL
jgi:CubicO group peptidase (beta-lactamase class C family)